MMRSRSNRDGKVRRKARKADPGTMVVREIDSNPRQARVFTRVLTTNSTLATGIGGFLGVLNVASSANVTSASNWGDYQAIAVEFRVVGVEIQLFPIVNTVTATSNPPPTLLAICAYSSDTVPGNFGEIAQGPGAKVFNGYRPFKFAASSKGFENAHLWNALTGGITPAVNIFGIAIADPGVNPVSLASTVYFRAVIKYMVQFRSLI